MMNNQARVWEELEQNIESHNVKAGRLIRALGESAIGVRAGYVPRDRTLELLIEVPWGWAGDRLIPDWRGMGHEVLDLHLPPRIEEQHLRLFLTSPEHRSVFFSVCEDMVTSLEGIQGSRVRVREIEACLLRWRMFFERSGPDGLSMEMQQGLFAELTLLQKMLEAGITPSTVVESWKGCMRSYHDFDLKGHVIEVKSTRSKEPRGVSISNERQLDDRGLRSLHLYALSLHVVEDGGTTLPERTEAVGQILSSESAALIGFRHKLVCAGYLDRDEAHYVQHFIIKSEDMFLVREGFPRIITLPAGVGELRYRVLLAACEPFRAELNDCLSNLRWL